MIETITFGIGIIIIVAFMLLNQYWSPNFSSSNSFESRFLEPRGPRPRPRIEKLSEKPKKEKPIIDLEKISLDELRTLDRTYRGTELGEKIHDVRRERVLEARDNLKQIRQERENKKQLYQELLQRLKETEPEELSLSYLERTLKNL